MFAYTKLMQAMAAAGVVSATDPYFNLTTLLLPGDGTNGAQNNTFLDSSSNAFSITRNGNTTQGTFTPFSQTGWSNYFDGTAGQYLNTPSNSALAFGTGDFAVEAWVFVTGTSWCEVYTTAFGSTPTTSMRLLITNAQKLYFFDGTNSITSTATIPLYTWVHVAASRFGTLVKLFINGIQDGSTTSSNNLTNQVGYIGRTWDGFIFTGYISNLRVVKGAAVYTSNFTPSTAPLTAVTGTSLLTCQNNRYVDNSANNFALTVNGTPSVQAFSPFVPAYITPTTYSNWFDGTGDYLTVPDNANLELGSGDFTIECWINTTVSNGGYVSAVSKWGSSNQSYMIRAASTDIGSGWSFFYSTNGTNYFTVFGSSINDGGWHHVAVTRSGNVFTTFTDGVLKNSTTDAVTLYNGTSSVTIGAGDAGANPFTGLISNLRIVKGTALYTASFTPPTAPLTAVTNTQLLTCQSSTFIDNSANAFTITANGNVQPVTSPTPFPAKVDTTTLNSAYSTSLIGGSAYFDGSGDYLNFTGNANTSIGGNDWTVEAWVYCTSFSQQYQQILRGETSNIILLMLETTAKRIQCEIGGGSSAFSPTTLQLNTWTHCAAVRSGSNVTVYINGVGGTPVTMNPTTTTTEVFRVGTDTSLARWLNGYVCGLRMVKGTALYTQNFAPPTLPPTAVTNTQLLLNYTNGAIFDSTAKNVLETVGNAQISTTQSKWGGSSMYFDGTGDYLVAPSNAFYNFGTGDFTIECWVRLITVGTAKMIVSSNYNSSTGGGGWAFVHRADISSLMFTCNGNVTYTKSWSPSTNTWYHIAVCRSGTNLRLFVDGTQIGTTSTSSDNITGASTLVVAGNLGGGSNLTLDAYMDDLRITNYARYTSNFTAPTEAFSLQ